MTLIDNWRAVLKRAWSIRVALLFGALNGAMLGLAAFADVINPFLFLGLNVIGWMVLVAARVLDQPGADI